MKNNTLYKFLNWEYWPSFMFYIPNVPYALYLAIKAKSPVFYSAANPAIKSSGNGTESKFETLELIPREFVPKSVLHKAKDEVEKTIENIEIQNITYPLIVKPNIGFRGLLVKKVKNKQELIQHLKSYPIDFIVQEYCDLTNECGIFFYKDIENNQFKISSLTLKKYLAVLGDGHSNVFQLLEKDKRAKLYIPYLVNEARIDTNYIPKKNQLFTVSTIGNHSKGTQFINGNRFITKELEANFQPLLNSISGFNYGRIDLKYNSLQELYKAQNFKVIEINGIIAEPTHIYDSQKSNYFYALKEIRKHWNYLYLISTKNKSENSIAYMKSMDFLNEIIQLKRYTKNIKSIQKTAL